MQQAVNHFHTTKLNQTYVPRNPVQEKIFQIIQKHWKNFEHDMATVDQPMSQYVKREFKAFLGCGIEGEI